MTYDMTRVVNNHHDLCLKGAHKSFKTAALTFRLYQAKELASAGKLLNKKNIVAIFKFYTISMLQLIFLENRLFVSLYRIKNMTLEIEIH